MADTATLLKNFETICKECDISDTEKELLYKKYFKYADNVVVASICDVYNKYTNDIKDMNEFMSNVISTEVITFINAQLRPLVVLTPDKIDHLRIYQNIIVDGSGNSYPQQVSVLEATSVFSHFISSYEHDLTIPGGEEKWKTVERISARLNAYVDMPTARALTRYFNMEKHMSDDKIRNLAEKIDTARKPMEIIYADRPEDFVIMYGSGTHSCMSTDAFKGSAYSFFGDNMTPTSFYAYLPWTRGAYIMKNGKILARVILYALPEKVEGDYKEMGWPNFNKSIGKLWEHGYIYGANEQATREFTKVLRSNGIRPLGDKNGGKGGGQYACPDDKPFLVPGIKYGREYAMPFPYFDNMNYYGKGFYASFDSKTNNFEITYLTKNNRGAINIQERKGFLQSSDYVARMCEHCNTTKAAKWVTTIINEHSPVSHLFCSNTCAQAVGFSVVYNGIGELLVKVKDLSIYTKSYDGQFLFTNQEAAKRQGWVVLKSDPFAFPEEGDQVVHNRSYDRVADKLGNLYGVTPENEVTAIVPLTSPVLKKNVQFDPEASLVIEGNS